MTHLGLVCLTSPNIEKRLKISYRTITRANLLKLSPVEQRNTLFSIYTDNAKMLGNAITFCANRKISMYRMSSSAFPFADQPEFRDLLPAEILRACGDYAECAGVRLLSHPDQFCVLSSDKLSVIDNSIAMLSLEAHVFDLIGLPQSQWAPINVHIGRKGPEARQTIVNVIRDMPENITSRLTLENDEFKQDAVNTLEVCQATGVAMLFDYHHEFVNHQLDTYDNPTLEYFRAAAATTWVHPEYAVCHLSNGRAHLHDKAHSDLITRVPANINRCNWLEIEAKSKEIALANFPFDQLGYLFDNTEKLR
jgi:UV DNA damage endonuclease